MVRTGFNQLGIKIENDKISIHQTKIKKINTKLIALVVPRFREIISESENLIIIMVNPDNKSEAIQAVKKLCLIWKST